MSAFGGKAAWRQCRHMTHRGSRDSLRVVVASPHHCFAESRNSKLERHKKVPMEPAPFKHFKLARRLGAIVCYSAALIQASRSHRTCSDGQRKSSAIGWRF